MIDEGTKQLLFAELDAELSLLTLIDVGFLPAAYSIFDEMHADIIKPDAKPVCNKGCSDCCTDLVYLTDLEFSYMLNGIENLHQKQSWWMEKMIKKSMGEYRQTFRSVLTGIRAFQGQTNACPFLYKQECMIYDHRPHFCRTLHSLDRNDCSKGGGDLIETVFDVWLRRVIRDHPDNKNDFPTGVAPLGHFLCDHFDND